MTIGLIALGGGLFCLWGLFTVLFIKTKSANRRILDELKRFREIGDLEQHANVQKAKAEAALAEMARAQTELARLGEKNSAHLTTIASQESQIARQQDQLASQTAKVEATLAQATQAQAEQTRLSESIAAHSATIANQESQITVQREQLAAHTANSEATMTQVAQAQSDLAELRAGITACFSTIGNQEAQITAQENKLAALGRILGQYTTLEELAKQIEKQKQTVKQYNRVLGDFKTAETLQAHIAAQETRVEELKRTIGEFETISELNNEAAIRRSQLAALESRIHELKEVLNGADTAITLHARIKEQQGLLASLQAQAKQVEEVLEMQEFGFYRPRYDFESSSKYQERLDQVREVQAAMVKEEQAVKWDKTWTVEGSESQGRKMMSEQTKLMLRAFNGECDAAVARVKYSNATTLESRITRSYEQINKLGKTNSSAITDKFLQLKLEELHLVHEHRVKQQQEKEEQQQIRDQMREEEKARREIEEAEEKAAKEEVVAERALDKARRAFEEATRGQVAATEQTKAQNAALATQVAKLENELKEAIDRKAKAIARAQLTRSGYIYVLSNIGSFGNDLYKLGMTRRLDPLDRVRELGDASVPFPFDVHAVIYSEDAPELECKLHRHFAERRVNLVNLRREYFRVTLEEIIAAVAEYFGEITFVKSPEAAEYRESMAKRKADGAVPLPAVQVCN